MTKQDICDLYHNKNTLLYILCVQRFSCFAVSSTAEAELKQETFKQLTLMFSNTESHNASGKAMDEWPSQLESCSMCCRLLLGHYMHGTVWTEFLHWNYPSPIFLECSSAKFMTTNTYSENKGEPPEFLHVLFHLLYCIFYITGVHFQTFTATRFHNFSVI